MSTSRLANILHKVKTEELSDRALQKILGQVARGETVKTKYKVVHTAEGYVEIPVEKSVVTTPADQIRGLMMIDRMNGLDLGLTAQDVKKADIGDAMKLYIQEDSFEEIVWSKKETGQPKSLLPAHSEGVVYGSQKADSDEEG